MDYQILIIIISLINTAILCFVYWQNSKRETGVQRDIASKEISIKSLERKLETISEFLKRLRRIDKNFVYSVATGLKNKNRIDKNSVGENLDSIITLFLDTAPYLDEKAVEIISDRIKPLSETLGGVGVRSKILEKLWGKAPGSAKHDALMEKFLHEIYQETKNQNKQTGERLEFGVDTEYGLFRGMLDLIYAFEGNLLEQYEKVVKQLYLQE